MRARWKRFRYRLEWLGLFLAAKLVPLLPRKACFHLANFLGSVISAFDQHGRKVVLSNLEVALGDQLSEAERHRVARESFQHFSRTMLELLWSPRLTPENWSRYVEFDGVEQIARDTGPERSFILACYHYSNFEWLSAACALSGMTGTIIAQEFKNSLLDPVFRDIRERSGHELIPRERGIVRLYKAMRRKGRTALLVDLTIPPDQGGVPIECFGLKTSVTSAHAWLHQQTGAPIFPAHCEPLPGGRYRVVFHPMLRGTKEMTLQQITQTCWNSFEPYVRKNPAPWLWVYKHWRYRPKNADRPYPYYSHIYEAFDEALEGL